MHIYIIHYEEKHTRRKRGPPPYNKINYIIIELYILNLIHRTFDFVMIFVLNINLHSHIIRFVNSN